MVDLCLRDQGLSFLKNFVLTERPDFIGVSVSTPNYLPAKRVVSMIKGLGTEGKILLGGPHASACKARALQDFGADVLFFGEAEESLPAYLEAMNCGRHIGEVAGLVFHGAKGIVETPFPGFVEDLDELPFPLWESIDPRSYPPIPHQFFVRELPVAPIMVTRGCPLNCYFCSSTRLYGAKLRKRSPKNVLDEMTWLNRDFGVREFHIEDDSLTLDRGLVISLCEELLASKINTPWKTPNGLLVNTLDKELLSLMRRAGCYQISLGIETLSQKSIDEMGKHYEIDRLKEIIADAHDLGLETQGLFIIGLPREDMEQMEETIREAPKLGLDLAHFSIFVPLPGSDYGDEILAGNPDFENINFFTPHFESEEKNRQVKSLQRRALLRFYLRLRPISLLLRMLKWRQLSGVVRVVSRYFF